MIRRFVRDGVTYGLASLLSRGVHFLILPFLTRALSPDEYGLLDYIAVLGSIVAVVVPLEVTQGVARYVPECRQDPVGRQGYASTSLWFTVFTYGILLLASVTFRERLAMTLFESNDYANLIILAAMSFGVVGTVYLLQNQLRWELRAKESGVLSLVSALLYSVLAVYLVVVANKGVGGVLGAQIAGGVLTSMLGLYFTRTSYAAHIDFGKLRQMLEYSVPLVPSSIGVFLALYIDRIAIKELLSLTDLGVYGVGYRVASIVPALMYGVQGALTPLIFTNYKQPETPYQLARIFRTFNFGALMLFIGLSSFAGVLISIFASVEYFAAAQVLPMLVLANLFSQMYIFAPGLSIAKKTGIIAVLNVSAAVVNMGLNLILIPRMGIAGAALATCVASAWVFVVHMFLSQRHYPVPHKWAGIVVGYLISVAYVIPIQLVEFNSMVYELALKATLISCIAFVLVKLGLIEPSELRELRRRFSRVSKTGHNG